MRYVRLSALLMCLASLASCAKPPRTPEETAAAISPEVRVQQIPSADAQKYTNARDMKSWRNPYLVVRVDGVALLDVSNNEQQIVNPDKLAEALASLSSSAWPYGRVVAIQEIATTGSEDDKAKQRKNRALVAGSLESMKVLINWVPAS
jgi:hypothetical protein